MMDFLRRLFAPEPSGATARERLRLVLLSDHLSLAPEVVESLRNELIAVISRYVEVDEAHCDVSFEQQDRSVAMLANIPILAMRSRPTPPGGPSGGSGTHGDVAAAPGAAAGDAPAAVLAVEASETAVAAPADAARSPRRRRRRRRAAQTASAAG